MAGFFVVASVVCALSLSFVATAAARESAPSGPGAAAIQVSGGAGSPTASAAGMRSTVVAGLPFTWLDLIALAAVALALSSVGFTLRRATVAMRA